MSEYSPLPGTVRSYDERVEFDEPCTRNRIGSGGSPGFGAPARLRQRLSFTLPLFAQYSALQIGPSAACAVAAPVVCACAEARPDVKPAPMPRPAPLRMVRRASRSAGSEWWGIGTALFAKRNALLLGNWSNRPSLCFAGRPYQVVAAGVIWGGRPSPGTAGPGPAASPRAAT